MDEGAPDRRLAEALGALSSPTRLALLRTLRSPKALAEIEVPPDEEGAERNIARQVVRRHLDKLLEVGAVRARDTERAFGRTTEFVLDNQVVYAIAEQLLDVARVRPVVEPDAPTVPALPPTGRRPAGPALVVARGLDPGTQFPLAPGPGPWIVGRRRGVAVALDFDPFVSSENARVDLAGGAHVVEDLATSRNGTHVNFRRLAKGERVRLAHGDLLGVGRSLLVYWSA